MFFIFLGAISKEDSFEEFPQTLGEHTYNNCRTQDQQECLYEQQLSKQSMEDVHYFHEENGPCSLERHKWTHKCT